jgi:hypothetical protein
LGNLVEFILSGGQEADIDQGEALIAGHDAGAAIEATGAAAAIPPNKNRIFKR